MKYIISVAAILVAAYFVMLQTPQPGLLSHRINTSTFVNAQYPFMHTKTDIRLEEEIYASNINYDDVLEVLQTAKRGDVVEFHLAGYGGDVQTAMYLIGNIKITKAYTIMSVEAPVYSAHAYIASQGDELRMAPYSYMMFHSSSVLDMDCSTAVGTDRGVPNTVHCAAFKENSVAQNIELLQNINILTTEEKVTIMEGYDVYLTKSEVDSRQLDHGGVNQ